MKKCFLAALLCVAAASYTQAQKMGQSVFAEIGGPGLASINYDTRFTKQNGGIGGRIGIGGFSIDGASLLTVPMALNYLLSKDNRNFFELGAGFTYLHISDRNSGSYNDDTFDASFGHLNIGYRLQPADGGFQFRAAITPIFNSDGFVPYYASLSFGYKF